MGGRRPLEERFWEKIEKGGPDECWEWVGAKARGGYGQITRGSWEEGTIMAHRAAWELTYGPIPAGEGYHGTCICHHCDNPSCVNPRHLFLGTQVENLADMGRKGRGISLSGELNGRTKLTWEEVREIRDRYMCGGISQRALAREFGIKQSQVNRIVNRKSWTI